ETKETRIHVELTRTRDAERTSAVTGLPFLDHMLTTLAHYAGLDLRITAAGDLAHHLIEDTAITIGQAVATFVPAGAARYGDRTIPMDDALVQSVIDVGGRSFFVGRLPSRLYTHVLRSFADALGATLHVRVLRGKDKHHIIEAGFKATGLALRQALRETDAGIFSTKGQVMITEEEIGDELSTRDGLV
ncbi:MAG TPA: hypothetical protein VNO21_18695, partial [Polyangiaceae bacterium]|nr:hypothetical protein [Polyangiaceae bacterium]